MHGTGAIKKPEQLSLSRPFSPFEDRHKFFDEIQGAVRISDIERDVIDTPEYQRLFRISQLGLVKLVFPSANHNRGIHSIGCCGIAKRLIAKVNENCKSSSFDPGIRIAPSERIIISLAALLHDISHGPFAHDIEKKNHEIRLKDRKRRMKSFYGPYEKHDDWESNPALYIYLLDQNVSCLSRVLHRHSPHFWQLLLEDAKEHRHLQRFVEAVKESRWEDQVAKVILPQLIFHTLIFEKPAEAVQFSKLVATSFDGGPEHWGLGPATSWAKLHFAWYQPYRHDVIGDTLSADLFDYLQRDARRLGINKGLDPALLNYYILVREDLSRDVGFPDGKDDYYRCAIDLNDYKRGTIRVERLNDIFRLLDLRHEIHEKAVFHRVVQSAIAMLSRSLFQLKEKKPVLKQIYGYADSPSPALAGEEHFLELAISIARNNTSKAQPPESQGLAQKLAERRVHHPLMVIPGDRVSDLDLRPGEKKLETTLRELAAVVDSRYFSRFLLFVSWCIEQLLEHGFDTEGAVDNYIINQIVPAEAFLKWSYNQPASRKVIFSVMPYKQLYKDPTVLVCVDKHAFALDTYKEKNIPVSVKNRIEHAMKDANSKYAASWKLYVFISDGLFYTGLLPKLLSLPEADNETKHKERLHMAQNLVVRAVRMSWHHWCAVRDNFIKSDSEDQTLPLMEEMPLEEFATLLTQFAADGHSFRMTYPEMQKEVSAVDVEHYVHGDGSRKCRDIQYKYDLIASKGKGKTISATTQAVLDAAHKDAKDFTRQELLELSHRLSLLGNHTRQLISIRVPGREEPDLDKDFLQRLWREEPDLF